MCVDKHYHIFVREKFKDVVFVYVSDDLKWGKEKLGKKARNRNFDLHFVGENTSSDKRHLERNRYLHAMYRYTYIILYHVTL